MLTKQQEFIASHHDALRASSRIPPSRGGGMREEALRVSAWEARERFQVNFRNENKPK